MIKRWLFFGALLAVCVGIIARVSPFCNISGLPFSVLLAKDHPVEPVSEEALSVRWTVPVPSLTDLAISNTGDSIAWTDNKGCVRRLVADTGKTLWRTYPLAGVNRVVVSPNGNVAAYSYLNPDRTSVVLLDAVQDADQAGKRSWIFAGSGAVWSVAFSNDETAYVGTGGKSLYRVSKSSKHTPMTTVGMPDSVAIASHGSLLALGTWAPASLSICPLTSADSCFVNKEAMRDRAYRVFCSVDGARILVLSTRGTNELDGTLTMYDASGALQWSVPLPEGAAHPAAMLSADGSYVGVTYQRTASRKDSNDWKLSYFNARGQRTFLDKGSALFIPRIVAISTDGSHLLVRSGDDTLYVLDSRGNFVHKLRLPANPNTGRPTVIERTTASDDGSKILILERGERLSLLESGF